MTAFCTAFQLNHLKIISNRLFRVEASDSIRVDASLAPESSALRLTFRIQTPRTENRDEATMFASLNTGDGKFERNARVISSLHYLLSVIGHHKLRGAT